MCRYILRLIGTRAILLLLLLMWPALPAQAAEKTNHPILYLFWGDGCPHCEEEKEFLDILRQDYPQVEMRYFELWNHPEFTKLADVMRQAYNIKAASVPMTFLGEWSHIGFNSFDTTGVEMIEQIESCLNTGCPDALSKAGPMEIAAQIRNDAARKAPNNWELFSPTIENTAKSSGTASDTKIMVYYFHGTYRCPSCTTIEELTDFAVLEGFQEELQNGTIEFKAINTEMPEHAHYVKDYQLYTKSVIVSEVVDGKEVRWKNLDKVWQLFMKEKVFTEYIQHEISAYLEELSL